MRGARQPVAMPSVLSMFQHLKWIDGSPLLHHVELYRQRLFTAFFDERDQAGRLRFNLLLGGRGKKNWKTADVCLAVLRAVTDESPSGSQVFILANDRDQASDDLSLLKKIISANPFLSDFVKVRKNIIERKDSNGFVEVLPAQDVAGSHGKTFRLVCFDEIHGYRTWDLLEAMQFDPTRPDAQMWITSYASLFHRPGVPLYDLCAIGRAGTDPRMLFSWYAADYTTDPDFADKTPEERANPSMASWDDGPGYLAQQQRRLPAQKFRRLHLNLPGLPEGSVSAEAVIDSIARGTVMRLPEPRIAYVAFVDMSGGSSDDACLAIAHQDVDGQVILDRIINQGQPPSFDPRKAVTRFVTVLREFKCARVTGDRYAGQTFACDFQNAGVSYYVSDRSKSELYEALEPRLNGHRVVLLDVSLLEQQLLGLGWKGGKIDHQPGEHDDWANAAAGAIHLAAGAERDERAAEVADFCLAAGDGVTDPLYQSRDRIRPESWFGRRSGQREGAWEEGDDD